MGLIESVSHVDAAMENFNEYTTASHVHTSKMIDHTSCVHKQKRTALHLTSSLPVSQ